MHLLIRILTLVARLLLEKVKKKNKDKTFQNLTVEQQIELLAIKAGIVKTDKVSDIK